MITKADLLTLYRKEVATTLRVMRAFPANRHDFSPHERSQDALRLMKTFVFEMWLNATYVFGDAHGPEDYKDYAPAGIATAIADFEKEALSCIARLEELPEEGLAETVEFGGHSFAKDQFMHMMLLDQVHHRGQLSVYVRMAGGKVPSIYGPSADDPSTNL